MPRYFRSPRHLRSRRPLGATAAVAALALAGTLGATATAGATVRHPAVASPSAPAHLPTAIEDLAAYVPADSCAPVERAGTVKLGRLLTGTYSGTSFQITRACGSDSLPTSEHYDGRALDWMVSARSPRGKARAQAVISWLFARDDDGNQYANARRLGVMYVIWNNRIWGAYNATEGWRPYSSCATHPSAAYDTTCHRNHMHISLSWEGARGRTSFWTKHAAAPDYGPCRAEDMNWAGMYHNPNPEPCPQYPRVVAPKRATQLFKTLTTYSGMRLHRGSTGTPVSVVQQALGITADGVFGSRTAKRVARWQRHHHLTGTGVMNVPTWRSLLKANAPKPAPKPPAPTPGA
jgi:peptidoglycan hydrolase-like protein with peptidoglycan-binding domain